MFMPVSETATHIFYHMITTGYMGKRLKVDKREVNNLTANGLLNSSDIQFDIGDGSCEVDSDQAPPFDFRR